MRKATAAEKAKLEAILNTVEFEVIRLMQRFAYLDAFLRELHAQTKGVQFSVRNEVVWQWFWDSYDAAVMNVASFSVAHPVRWFF